MFFFIIEALAATEAGLQTVISVRPGNAPLTDEDRRTYKIITSFHELLIENLEREDVKKAKTDNES